MPDQTTRRAAPWRLPHWSRRGSVPCCVSAALLAVLIGTGRNADTSPTMGNEAVAQRTATVGGRGDPTDEAADFDEEGDWIPAGPDDGGPRRAGTGG